MEQACPSEEHLIIVAQDREMSLYSLRAGVMIKDRPWLLLVQFKLGFV
jgi:hypothetical protein